MTGQSPDACLQLVADRRRRLILQLLRHGASGNTTVDDLADRLYNSGAVSDERPTDREQLAIQLYHIHLPKLADYGVVEYDHRSGVVRYRSDGQVESLLDTLPDDLSIASS